MEIESIEYRHHTIRIHQDEHPHDTPRDWSNLGTMTCFHSRYLLGDKHEMSVEDLTELIERPDVISRPLYLYDHSGITMQTRPFSCPWDSGQVGYIWVTKEEVRKEYSVKRISPKLLDRVISYLVAEVEVYDQHLRGEVYGFVIEDEEGEHIDSCWGYYGDPEKYIVPEAKGIVDHITQEQVGLIY